MSQNTAAVRGAMGRRVNVILIAGLLSPAAVLAQQPDPIPATPPFFAWMSAGLGGYRAVKLREQPYDLNSFSGLLGQGSLWIAGHGLAIGGRVSRGSGIRGSLTPRDERSLLVGVRARNRLGHAVIAMGIARAKYDEYYQDDVFLSPTRHARDERGLALGGELARTGKHAGIGLSVVGVSTKGARYAALTASLQLGRLK